jgi:hypothetical protein
MVQCTAHSPPESAPRAKYWDKSFTQRRQGKTQSLKEEPSVCFAPLRETPLGFGPPAKSLT